MHRLETRTGGGVCGVLDFYQKKWGYINGGNVMMVLLAESVKIRSESIQEIKSKMVKNQYCTKDAASEVSCDYPSR